MKRYAFTLIELLVVIAIIALLVGILLPALGKARTTARMAKSLSNMRNITVAQQSYRIDNRDFFPPSVVFYGPAWMTSGHWSNPNTIPGGAPPLSINNAPWSVGGKFNHTFWQTIPGSDIPPQWRYLTPYMSPETSLKRAVPFSVEADRATPDRENYQFDIWNSPGDRRSMWRAWGQGQQLAVNQGISSYDDVGTSYCQNYIWHTLFRAQQAPDSTFSQVVRTLLRANSRLNSGAFNASRFVTISDGTGWIVINDAQRRSWPGEFGGQNKAVMGFFDGHADYVQMERRTQTADDLDAPTGAGSLSSRKPYEYSYTIPVR